MRSSSFLLLGQSHQMHGYERLAILSCFEGWTTHTIGIAVSSNLLVALFSPPPGFQTVGLMILHGNRVFVTKEVEGRTPPPSVSVSLSLSASILVFVSICFSVSVSAFARIHRARTTIQ